MPIKILPLELINKIAAGEIIERPASIVKELVENSIDAGATQITVEIQEAGKKLIRVSDNGCGMSKSDLELAIKSHATSKIAAIEDLANITTLGFRGEALPSICSVAKVEMTSKAGDGIGAKIEIEGGQIKKHEETGCPPGTSISVKELFYNVPARKKFLKSDHVEAGHINSIVSKFILSRPEIQIKLANDGKTVYASSGNGNFLDAVAAVYGSEIAKDLLKVESPSVSGYVSKPNLSRVDRNYESIFVNGRYVKNALLSSALESSFRTLIPSNRYPVGIIFISVNPSEVDVNVHPSKREVKFQNTKAALDHVSLAVKAALDKINVKEDSSFFRKIELPESWSPQMSEALFSSPMAIDTLPDVEIEVTEVQPLVPVHQFKETYIVATNGEEIVLIDQHAAHERVLYDQLKKSQTNNSLQSLLVPENVEFTRSEAALIEQNRDYLKNIGFDLEVFGENSYIVRATPAQLPKINAKQILQDIAFELLNLEKQTAVELRREKILKIMACRGAVKAGDRLASIEINRLIRDLYKTENPLTCPHGRPTMIRISMRDLEKMFERIK